MKTVRLKMWLIYHRYVSLHMRRDWEPELQSPTVSLKLLLEKMGAILRNSPETVNRSLIHENWISIAE